MSEKNTPIDLKLDTSYRQILSIALPIMVAVFIPNINFFTNNYFLGHFDSGGDMLAVAGITGVYYLAFAVIGYGLNGGVQSLMSRRAGADSIEDIGKFFWNGLRVALILSFVAIMLSHTVGAFLLKNAMKSPELAQTAVDFLKIRIFGIPFLLTFQLCNALMISTNNSKLLIFGTLAETLAHIFFDYSLIFGHFGFPKLGFIGAAYASVMMEMIGLLVTIFVLYHQKIVQKFDLFRQIAYDRTILGLIAMQSFPLIFQQFIAVVSWEYFFIAIERHSQELRHDTLESAITNVMRNFFSFFGCTSWAFGSTANNLISNIIGQGKTEKVMPTIHRIMWLSFGISCVFAIVLNLFPTFFLSFFGQSAEFVDLGVPILRIVSIAIMMMALGSVTINALNATGKTKVTFYIEAFNISLYTFYVWLILAHWKLSLAAGWSVELMYWVLMIILPYFYVKSNRWLAPNTPPQYSAS